MKQRSILWQAAGFALVTFVGTILHFLYDWTGESILVAPFSGVNESTWEHMKLLFWPLFLFALIQRLFFKNQENEKQNNFAVCRGDVNDAKNDLSECEFTKLCISFLRKKGFEISKK